MRDPPCIVFEDEDLLVVNKPPGWNTHAPSPHAGEGIYDWLKHREPRWARLAIVHRLDRDTSGLMVFGKTPAANRSLTAQFTGREVQKHYALVTGSHVPRDEFTMVSAIMRVGERYASRPLSGGGPRAETRFRVLRREAGPTWVEAQPVTGRTHQIRVHAAAGGLPVLGDVLYGGNASHRLHLHATGLAFRHPASGAPLHFSVAPDFSTPPGRQLREAIIDRTQTSVFRAVHGSADGCPGLYRDRLGEWQLLEGEEAPAVPEAGALLGAAEGPPPVQGVYFKRLLRQVGRMPAHDASPRLLAGAAAPARFPVRENGVCYDLSLAGGYSTGLFPDQRDNRRRLLHGHVAAGFSLYPETQAAPAEVLNCFAYTCAFSICAALGGARVTSLDLSRRYLDWGRHNFTLNGLDPQAHDFIYGDAFDWLKRLARKDRRFDVILLDPPTFSRSPVRGDFRAETDYGQLVSLALPLLRAGGVLFASTNAARLGPAAFIGQVHAAIRESGRGILQEHYVPQPPDFPVTRAEPAYLKTIWLRVADTAPTRG
ncbi:MAG: class I SAM-dependent methyltransferase [Gammaproteobacteria bacterium]|nr:class I SAM-dependent methyltransferase [Gammaproteobacteria bacterium]